MKAKPGTRGFETVELLVILAVLGAGAVLLLSNIHNSRQSRVAQRISCANNLCQIRVAIHTWALDHTNFPTRVSVTNGGTMELAGTGLVYLHFIVMSNELSTPRILSCIDDTVRMAQMTNTFGAGWLGWGAQTNNRGISYFLNVDADETYENVSQAVLCGDDNLLVNGALVGSGVRRLLPADKVAWAQQRHHGAGNLLMLDGSVRSVRSRELPTLLTPTALDGDQLAFP